MTRTIVLLLLAILALPVCAWTMSKDRSKRISDCLARCQAMGAGQTAPYDRQDPGRGQLRDSRTGCEQACHSR